MTLDGLAWVIALVLATLLRFDFTGVPDDTWAENTITWNNRPASLEVAFARWTVQAGQPVELDITSLVQQAQAGDGKLSLRIFSTRNVGGSGLVNYGSRQGSAADRPQLVLITAD